MAAGGSFLSEFPEFPAPVEAAENAREALQILLRQDFDIVVVDPPAFAKSKKDKDAGLRAYGRMARLAAPLVAPAASSSPPPAAITPL